MPVANEALPGRNAKIPVPVRRYVDLCPLELRFPDGTESEVFRFRCFGSSEHKSPEIRGAYSISMDYPRRCVPRRPAITRSFGRFFRHRIVSCEVLFRVFPGSHDPTPGMRQGNDMGSHCRSGVDTTTTGIERPR